MVDGLKLSNFESGRQDLNLRPDGPKPPDLPTDLLPEIFADVTGVEPAPNCVTGRHLNRLTSHPYLFKWWDSNPHRTLCSFLTPNQAGFQLPTHLVFENSFTLFSKEYFHHQTVTLCCPTRVRTSTLLDQNQTCCQLHHRTIKKPS